MSSILPNQSAIIEADFVKNLGDLIANDCFKFGYLSSGTIRFFEEIEYRPKSAAEAIKYLREHPIARNEINSSHNISETQQTIEQWKQVHRYLIQIADRFKLEPSTNLDYIVRQYRALYYV